MPEMCVVGEFDASKFSFSVNAGKNQMQFFCFSVECSRLIDQRRFRGGDHSEKKLCLFCFFNTTSNRVFEIFL